MKSTHQRTTALFVVLMSAIAVVSNVCQGQATNRVLAYSNMGYASIPHSPRLQNPTEMTIEAWTFQSEWGGIAIFKSDGLNMYTDRSYEMGSGSGSTAGNVGIGFFLGSSVWAGCGSPIGLVSTGRWAHVAATFKSSDGLICLYVNGVLAASATNDNSGTIPLKGLTVRQSSEPLVLGYDYPVTIGAPGPHGYLDEVRVWSVARSAAEIQQTMYQRLTGTEPNLEGYWNFNNGTVADATTNHLDGTFHDGATTIIDSIPVSVQISVASVAVSFPTGSPLTTYQVQYSTNVPAANWISIGGPLPGNGTVQSVTDSVYGQPTKYYRVIFY